MFSSTPYLTSSPIWNRPTGCICVQQKGRKQALIFEIPTIGPALPLVCDVGVEGQISVFLEQNGSRADIACSGNAPLPPPSAVTSFCASGAWRAFGAAFSRRAYSEML